MGTEGPFGCLRLNARVHHSPNLIYSIGTQVVALRAVVGPNGEAAHPAGAVGVVVRAPRDREHAYRIRFVDGFECPVHHDHLMLLAEFKQGELQNDASTSVRHELFQRVIYRCVVGSRAFGLDDEDSDTDLRGVYLPPADLQWSLYGVPEQLEREETQEAYWELQKFLVLALKGNPNILECLYTPLVEFATPLAEELLAMRGAFLSRLVYQTYNGYVMSQFKRMQGDLRNHGQVKPKHVMHLIRLLLSGIHVLREGVVRVDVGEHRDRLLAIKRGELATCLRRRRSLAAGLAQGIRHGAHGNQPSRAARLRARERVLTIKARRLAVEDALP
jgi:predicted nucleotidyltransferase